MACPTCAAAGLTDHHVHLIAPWAWQDAEGRPQASLLFQCEHGGHKFILRVRQRKGQTFLETHGTTHDWVPQ